MKGARRIMPKGVYKHKGHKISEEHKKKISKANKGKIPWSKGKHFSKEHRGKLSIAHKNKKFSDEHKRNISIAKKGKDVSKNLGKYAKKGLATGENHPAWQGGESTNFPKQYKRKYRKKYIENNREHINFLNIRRRARKEGAEGSHTLEEWEALKAYYGNMCLCCKRCEPEIKLTEDHIIPLIKGGSDWIENIQPLCRSCNCKKHTKTIKYKIKNIYEKEKTNQIRSRNAY